MLPFANYKSRINDLFSGYELQAELVWNGKWNLTNETTEIAAAFTPPLFECNFLFCFKNGLASIRVTSFLFGFHTAIFHVY